MLIVALIFLFLLLLSINFPVAFILILISTIYVLISGLPLSTIGHILTSNTDSFPLLAMPLFFLVAFLMETGGVLSRMVTLCRAVVGHIPGGLAQVNVLASVVFAGMSGSCVADAGGLGKIEIKIMRDGGYSSAFAASVTAASSVIGPIIPPSIPMVIYAVLVSESVGKLFVGAIIPGFMMAGSLMLLIYFLSKKKSFPTSQRATRRTMYEAVRQGILPLFTPIIILGGMISGIFTPTEAAFVAALYAAILGMLIYRLMGLIQLTTALYNAAKQSAVMSIIVAAASLWGWMLIREGFITTALDFITSITANKWIVLTILNFILLFMGMFLEPIAIMTLTIPVLLPLMKIYEISKVHYGVVMVVILMIGMCTPPYGEALFLVSSIAKAPFGRVAKEIWPFIAILTVIAFLITYVPFFVEWLPQRFFL